MHTPPERYSEPEQLDYRMLPKNIGEVSSWQLLDIAKQNAKKAEELGNQAAGQFYGIAGSAYIEAAIVDDSDVDARLAYLDEAAANLNNAADIEYDFLESGYRHPNDQIEWLRAELNYDFMDVYRDIVCGEVTERTKDEITDKLIRHKKYAKLATNTDHGSRAVGGFDHELTVLLKTWQAYKETGDTIAFPSTARGGDGRFRRSETHDVVFAWQDIVTENWNFAEAEVKGGRGRTRNALVRYQNTLLFVDGDGEIRTFGPLNT